jgi:hypothetical protein
MLENDMVVWEIIRWKIAAAACSSQNAVRDNNNPNGRKFLTGAMLF